MPLRAIIEGENVLSPFLSEEAWATLHTRIKAENLDVRLPCCNNQGYLRTSSRGLFHFVHKRRGDCTSAPETWQHMKAKYEIVRGCRAAGYEAITEAAEEDWRADVLAVKGKARIAFEVQWSSQTLEETEVRQARYAESGVRGCWFFRRIPFDYVEDDLPAFGLDVDDDCCDALFHPASYSKYSEPERIPLADFVQRLLTGKYKFCERKVARRKQEIMLIFTRTECYRCKKPYDMYYMRDSLKSKCGTHISIDERGWSSEKFFMSPQILAVARAFTRTPEGQHIQLSYVKERYSATVGHSYKAFGCSHCDAICGDFFLFHEIIPAAENGYGLITATHQTEITLSNSIQSESPHWCYSANNDFCC